MDENIPLKGSPPPATFNSVDNDSSNRKEKDDEPEEDVFSCNICLEPVKDKDPVVTQCGHLYCWPCLYRWMNTNHTTCPVCKAGVTQENIIPIFIKGSTDDPRAKTAQEEANIPSRPQARRPESNPTEAATGNNAQINIGYNFGGISFSAGFGFFPSLFGLQFQSFAPATPNASQSEEDAQQAYLSRVLLFLGVGVILCLLFF